MKANRWLAPALAGLTLAAGGCVRMPRLLSAGYFEPRRSLRIEVSGGLPAPTLHTDQPQTGTARLTWLTRSQAMQNRMAGISPARIHAAVRAALADQLAETFLVTDDDAQLVLKVVIDDWGWYVPTGTFGESRDLHSFRLGGTAAIADPAQAGAEVFFTYNQTDTPLGDRLTPEKCEAALAPAAADFAAQIVRFILKGKPAPPP